MKRYGPQKTLWEIVAKSEQKLRNGTPENLTIAQLRHPTASSLKARPNAEAR
jgi:hypothetical protein